jgi:DNA polymerase
MGHAKFFETCQAFGVRGITEDLAKKAVQVYRETHHKVTQAWYNIERAAILAVQNVGKSYKVHKVEYHVEGGFLWCKLPSGRRLAYYQPLVKTKDTPWGEPKACLHYEAVNSQTRKSELVHTYGGSLVENICQAISADVMRSGVLNATAAGFTYLFDVHDELVSEAKTGTKNIDDFIRCLTTLPAWASGLPVKAEGWSDFRFRK